MQAILAKSTLPLILLFLLIPQVSGAQPNETNDTSRMISTAIVTATVEVTDVALQSNGENSYTISYSLSNTIGAQSGIRTGLYIDDDDTDGIYGIFIPGVTTDSLGQGQSIDKFGTFKIPDFFSEKQVSIFVVALNENGLPLARVLAGQVYTQKASSGRLVLSECTLKIGDESRSYESNYGVDLRSDEKGTVSCAVENESTKSIDINQIELKTYRRSLLNEPIDVKSLNVNLSLGAGEKKTLAFELLPIADPQAYHVSVLPKVSIPTNGAFFQYVTAGVSATVQNLKVNKSTYSAGEDAYVYFFYTESAQNYPNNRLGKVQDSEQVTLTVSSETGTVCGQVTIMEPDQKNSYVRVPIEKDCANVTVDANIVDMQTGGMLDKTSLNTSGLTFDESLNALADDHRSNVDGVTKELAKIQSFVTPLFALTSLFVAIIIIAGISFYLNRRKKNNMSKTIHVGLLIITASAFCMLAERVEAASVTFNDYRCETIDDGYNGGTREVCVGNTTYTVTINHTQSSFSSSSNEPLKANLTATSQYLNCTNICDCQLTRDMIISTSIRNSANSTVHTQNGWRSIRQQQFVEGAESLYKKILAFFAKESIAAAAPTYTYMYDQVVVNNVSALGAGSYTARYSITGRATGPYTSETTGSFDIPFTVNPGAPVVKLSFGSNMFAADPLPFCSDGKDNDGDGFIDSGDPGCTSLTDNDESNPAQCSDGYDNDIDGKTDYPNDPGCINASDNDEKTYYQCENGLDDDGDGLIDYGDDPDCTSPFDNVELYIAPKGPGTNPGGILER